MLYYGLLADFQEVLKDLKDVIIDLDAYFGKDLGLFDTDNQKVVK